MGYNASQSYAEKSPREQLLKKLFNITIILILLVFAFVLGVWGINNGHYVDWHLLVYKEPIKIQMAWVMATLLFAGVLLGMLLSFIVMAKMRFARKLKARQAQKEAKKLEQNQALAQQPGQEPQPTTTTE